jgi:hypothetical protein
MCVTAAIDGLTWKSDESAWDPMFMRRPPSPRWIMWRAIRSDEERRLHVEIDCQIELRLGKILHRPLRAPADVVHQGLYPSELVDRLIDGRVGFAEVHHIHLEGQSLSPHPSN